MRPICLQPALYLTSAAQDTLRYLVTTMEFRAERTGAVVSYSDVSLTLITIYICKRLRVLNVSVPSPALSVSFVDMSP